MPQEPSPSVIRKYDPADTSILTANPDQYEYANFGQITDPNNVVNIERGDTNTHGEIQGIFTSGLSSCVALCFLIKNPQGEIIRMSMMHVPGSIGSSTFDGLDGPPLMRKMLEGAPPGSKVEVVIAWNREQYENDWERMHADNPEHPKKTTLVDEDVSEAIQKVLTERGYILEKIDTYWGKHNNLTGSNFSFGINFQGECGEFKNCRGNYSDEKNARIRKEDPPTTPAMAVFMLKWARSLHDEVFFKRIKKDLKTESSNPNYAIANQISFHYSLEELPLKDLDRLREMMITARNQRDSKTWKTIKDALVDQINKSHDKAEAVAARKDLLTMHYNKDSHGEYKGSLFCRIFQKGETTHWGLVKQFENTREELAQTTSEHKERLRRAIDSDTNPLLGEEQKSSYRS